MEIRCDLPELPAPTLADARVVGDPASGSVLVLVGAGVAFEFARPPGGTWGSCAALTAALGVAVTPAWLAAGLAVAAEALRRALSADGAEEEADTVRCDACGKVLCSREIRGAGPVKVVFCGPGHTLTFASGRSLSVEPDGGAAWWP